MLFLAAKTLKDTALAAFRTLCAVLCQGIYKIVALSYKLFIELATFKLLSSANLKQIYGRVTMILTIVMVFYVTFEFVKYAVDPDKMTDKEQGISKIPQRLLLIVILIAMMPNMFTILHNIQLTVIKNDTITKIILGKTYQKGDSGNEYEKMGNNFAWGMLNMFYDSSDTADCDGLPCNYIVELNEASMINYGSVPYLTLGINATHEVKDKKGTYSEPYINFEPLWAVLVGGFIAYMLILYCIDLGARSVQMVYLQLISPIAIIGILSPKKDNMFQKWLKQLMTTYLDVFIRLIVINFVILVSNSIINDVGDSISSLDMFGKIAVVLGLLVFAKRAPKLLAELFPSMGSASGNFGLKPGDRNLGRAIGAALGLATGVTVGAATGVAQGIRRMRSVDTGGMSVKEARRKKAWAAISGGATGLTRGTVGGAARGLSNGAKKGNVFKNAAAGAKAQAKSNKYFGNRQENGYTTRELLRDKIGGAFGASTIEELEKKKAPKERLSKERQAEIDSGKRTSDKAFENAVTKGKGSSDARVRKAVEKYNALDTLDKDFQDPNSAKRAEYRAGQVVHDSAKRAAYDAANDKRKNDLSAIDTDAYKAGIDESSLGIDKDKFNKQKTEKEYDKAAHEAAKDQYMRDGSIIGPDGKPMKVFDQEAWEKDKDKFTKEKVTDFFDQEAYDAAVEEAKDKKAAEYRQKEEERINKEFNDKVTADGLVYTAETAEAALSEARADLAKEKKAAKDQVQFAYEDWALQDKGDGTHNDDELYRWSVEDQNRIDFYNRSATVENRVNKEAEVRATMETMAREMYAKQHGVAIDTVTATQAESLIGQISRAEAEDKWRKERVSQAKLDAQTTVDDATAAIEAHKRKTAGSSDKN